MSEIIPHATLKHKQRNLRVDFPETMGLRVHRSISWIGRAEAISDDHDAGFLFLWIAFNASYADESALQGIAEKGSGRRSPGADRADQRSSRRPSWRGANSPVAAAGSGPRPL